MSIQRVREAENEGLRLLRSTWAPDLDDVPLPVDPVHIARRLGVEVFNADLDGGVSGLLIKRAFHDAEIYVNANDSRNRRRFTCAHELGHYVERDRSDGEAWEYVDYRDARSSRGVDHDERFANGFAASLLMPRPVVGRLRRRGLTVLEMAVRFDVSVEAMTYRLENVFKP